MNVKITYNDSDGKQIGTFDENLILSSILYDVGFLYGAIKQYAKTKADHNMYLQIDSDGYSHTIPDVLINYDNNDQGVSKEYKYIVTRSDNHILRETIIGWNLLIKWKYGKEQWVPLKLTQEYNLIKVENFAKARNIGYKSTFFWLLTPL